MTIARYPGRCSSCGSPTAVGDEISPYGVGWAHARCASEDGGPGDGPPITRIDRSKKRPGEEHCPQCFLLHPEGACDW